MRFRLPLNKRLFFVAAFLFALVALLPLGLVLNWLALDERGFAAREAEGSVWLGIVREGQFGTIPLGDLEAKLRLLPLAIGRARVDLRQTGDGRAFEGGLTVSRHAFGVDDVRASLSPGPAFAPLPVASFDLTDVSAHFTDGLCAGAEGLVKASLAGESAGIALPRSLSGNARCDGGALLLPLVSQSGTERLDLRLYEGGRYRIELIVRAADEPTRQRLTAAGFSISGAGLVLRTEGQF
jgi:general secretion pathway protein N